MSSLVNRFHTATISLIIVFLLVVAVVVNSKQHNGIINKKSKVSSCQVVIAGGSTAAFAAALSSATEGVKTCLLEPTDWIGGQMTTSGVSAIDFAWQRLQEGNSTFDVPKIDKDPANVTPNFYTILQKYGHTGQCWVSNYCYLPKSMLENGLWPLYDQVKDNLEIYTNTVVKRVKKDGSYISELHAIRRKEKPDAQNNCLLLSEELLDWYDEQESDRFTKESIVFYSESAPLVIMDATDWGELLALSGADYLQGLSEQYDGDVSGVGNDRCGQSIVYGFAQRVNDKPTKEPENPYPNHHEDFYSTTKYTWNQIWTYRRLYTKARTSYAEKGDVTLQNWEHWGNDYYFGYLFLSRQDTKSMVQSDMWNGGLDMDVLRESEYLAYGWHYWFKNYNKDLKDYITLDREAFGTCHGLSKLPYIRDTRRSIGIDDFVIKISDLTGNFTQSLTGKVPFDHVAIGTYSVDIHRIDGCEYPSYMNMSAYTALPFFIPYRAMTNRKVPNLLVTGKLMAQSFLSNAATRLHPIEWSSGTATGVAAAFIVKNSLPDTASVVPRIRELQTSVARYTPIRWTIDGKLYPANN